MYEVMHAEAAFDSDEVIRRARTRLGEKRYRLLTNNCEHFVEWCLHGVHRSFEVETALNFPRWFGERILAALFSAKRCSRGTLRVACSCPRAPTARVTPPPRARFGAGFRAGAAACWLGASCGAA